MKKELCSQVNLGNTTNVWRFRMYINTLKVLRSPVVENSMLLCLLNGSAIKPFFHRTSIDILWHMGHSLGNAEIQLHLSY